MTHRGSPGISAAACCRLRDRSPRSRTEPVSLQGTAYRGTLPPGSPAQVFEGTPGRAASERVNEYALAPVRAGEAAMLSGNTCLIDAATAAPVRGRPVAFIWLDQKIRSHASSILDVASVRHTDGNEYVAMKVAFGSVASSDHAERESVALISPSQRAFARTSFFALLLGPIVLEESLDTTLLDVLNDVLNLLPGDYTNEVSQTVDALAVEIAKTQSACTWMVYIDRSTRATFVILQVGEALKVHRVTRVEEELCGTRQWRGRAASCQSPDFIINPEIKSSFFSGKQYSRIVIHYNMHDVGRIMRLAHTELTPGVVLNTPPPLEGIHDNPTNPLRASSSRTPTAGVSAVDGNLDVSAERQPPRSTISKVREVGRRLARPRQGLRQRPRHHTRRDRAGRGPGQTATRLSRTKPSNSPSRR